MVTDIPLNNRLIDRKVLGFYSWKLSLEDDDELEHGHVIHRPRKALHELYGIYKKYQERSDVSERRKYLYGDQMKTEFKAVDNFAPHMHKIMSRFSVRAIITQLKDQAIFNYCRQYIKFGCKIKSINISDDFKDMNIDLITPVEIRAMEFEARFTK